MSQGIQFIDIIFLGLVAGFLVLRLRSVLGRRTGNEKQRDSFGRERLEEGRADSPDERPDNVVELPGRRAGNGAEVRTAEPGSPLDAGLTQIRLADRSFEPDQFLGGARKAFEMIVEAFAKGDCQALRPLLADDVYHDFEGAIAEREGQGRGLKTEIVSFRQVRIVGAEMRGRLAAVTVRFVTEQVVLTTDSEGRIIEGDPSAPELVTDDWTFSRDTSARDPNWQLVGTATPDDEA